MQATEVAAKRLIICMDSTEQRLSAVRILLLPGMDGTGDLLLDFVRALPSQMHTRVPTYPKDRFLSYDDLAKLVRFTSEDFEPKVILAESFSTPLAIRIAAERPENLKALILCAGFAASPVRGMARWLGLALPPLSMRTPLPASAIRSWLVGGDAPEGLIQQVGETISSVRPNVLAARLRAVLRSDARSDLGKVQVPVLYLQARQDRLVRARCLEEIRQIKPDIQSRIIDGPHFLLQRYPTTMAAVVTDFITSVL